MSEFFVYSIGTSSGEPNVGYSHSAERSESQPKPAPEVKSPVPTYTFPGNTRLIYKVNEDDHEVVVFIVDEQSSEVIRTVPGDAMEDIPSGGLLQKNA